MVVDEYLKVLKPYIKDGSAGSTESTSTSTATDSTGEQSSTDVSKEGKQEYAHKVPTDEELIVAIDATRRRVEESTRRTAEFLEELKKQNRR